VDGYLDYLSVFTHEARPPARQGRGGEEEEEEEEETMQEVEIEGDKCCITCA
jgi:hypothetical protein